MDRRVGVLLAGLALAGAARAGVVNLAVSKNATASSAYNATYAASKGNDNSTASLWGPLGSDTSPWWQVDLGSPRRITEVQLVSRQDTPAVDNPEARKNFEVRGSNSADGTGHTVLATQGGTAFAKYGTWTAAVTDEGTYRYLRVAKTDAQELTLAEFRVFSSLPLVNAGFDTGDTTGWSMSGASSAYSVSAGEGTVAGSPYALTLNNNNLAGSTVASQTVTTVPGTGYALQFWFGAFGAKLTSNPQRIRAELLDGTTVLATGEWTAVGPGAYTPGSTVLTARSLAFTAVSSTTSMRFTDLTTVAGSASSDGVLDAVEVGFNDARAATPVFTPPAGPYETPQEVTITCATAGSTIRYTTDGSAPSRDHGAAYAGAVPVSSTVTFRAIAMKAGIGDSEVVDALYVLPNPGTVLLLR